MREIIHAFLYFLAVAPINETTNAIVYAIEDASRHWLLAASMGFWVWASMRIMLSATLWVWAALTHRKASTAAVCGTVICPLLLGLSAALVSHWALDYFAIWWVTPLGEGLDLVMP